MLRFKDSVTGLLLVALGVGVLWATADFPTGVPVAQDAALLPRVVAIGIVICGVILVALSRAGRRVRVASGADAASEPPVKDDEEVIEQENVVTPGWQVTIVLGVATVTYAYSAFELGFIVSTVAFVIAAGFILGRDRSTRSVLVLIIYAVGIAAAAFIGFFELLNVRMPVTPLP